MMLWWIIILPASIMLYDAKLGYYVYIYELLWVNSKYLNNC